MKKLVLASSGTDFLSQHADQLPLTKGDQIVYVPTAGYGEDPVYISDAPKLLTDMGYQVSELDLRNIKRRDVENALADADMVYVSGGNTFFLLDHARKSGFAEVITERVKKGLPYFGSSAGAMLVGPTIAFAAPADDPAKAPDLTDHTGLDLVDFLVVPHTNREEYAKAFKKEQDRYSDHYKMIPIADGEAVLVEDDEHWVVS